MVNIRFHFHNGEVNEYNVCDDLQVGEGVYSVIRGGKLVFSAPTTSVNYVVLVYPEPKLVEAA